MGLLNRRAGAPSCSPSSWALNLPSLGLSPLPPPTRDPVTHLPLSLSLSPHPSLPPFRSPLCPLLAPHHPLPAAPPPPSRCSDRSPPLPPFSSYFLAVTSQRHPDVRPQITSRDLGFRSEVLYFCTMGWAPGPRWRKHSPRCHLCLHLRGCGLPLPPGWALGPLGGAASACLWSKCGAVRLCLPGPCVPSPEPPSCMADTASPGPVTSPP